MEKPNRSAANFIRAVIGAMEFTRLRVDISMIDTTHSPFSFEERVAYIKAHNYFDFSADVYCITEAGIAFVTKYENAELDKLELRMFLNTETENFLVGVDKPTVNKSEWRTLPKEFGIIWHSDQSCNELLWHSTRNDVNYRFNPVKEPQYVEEYKDIILDHYR